MHLHKVCGCLLPLVVFGSLTGCTYTWKWNVPVPDHLYAYPGVRVADVIEGHEVVRNSLGNFRRNASGTRILVDEYGMPTPRTHRRTYVFSREHRSMPQVVMRPDGASYYLDDDAELLAWSAEDSILQFADGGQLDLRRWRRAPTIGFDPGGRFMYAHGVSTKRPSPYRTSIYRTSSLEEPVVEFDSGRPPLDFYAHGDRLIVHGNISNRRRTAAHRRNHEFEELRIFELNNGSFIELPPIPIPRGVLVDIDPWSDLVFVHQHLDLPLPDKYFLLNMRSGEITNLGALRRAMYMFLAEDVLGDDLLASDKGK